MRAADEAGECAQQPASRRHLIEEMRYLPVIFAPHRRTLEVFSAFGPPLARMRVPAALAGRGADGGPPAQLVPVAARSSPFSEHIALSRENVVTVLLLEMATSHGDIE